MGSCTSKKFEKPQVAGPPKSSTIKKVQAKNHLKRGHVNRQGSTSSGVSSGSSSPNSISIEEHPAYTISKHHKSPVLTVRQSRRLLEKLREQPIVDDSVGYVSQILSNTDSKLSTSRELESPYTPNSHFDMEMYMITQTKGLMRKTSSPIPRHRNVTFTLESDTQPSVQFLIWSELLEHDAGKIVHDISKVPEALSGNFSPGSTHI